MDRETYAMEFTCPNCSTNFERAIPFGETTKGRGGMCPYCGYHLGYSEGSPHKPHWIWKAEQMRNMATPDPD